MIKNITNQEDKTFIRIILFRSKRFTPYDFPYFFKPACTKTLPDRDLVLSLLLLFESNF